MQTIQATNYSVFFNETGYEKLASYLVPTHYSKIFILVDENTSQYCLPHLLNNLATEIEIEIIELEAGENHKNIAIIIFILKNYLHICIKLKGR